ncbi:MAG: 3-deoxy-manno-octulosonate cytidylyltransferase [Bacteroidales bacterium]|jgi:3-deoxy-manno-octulosonate cytidylyltransferase (CMP-KDO synthetase)|nr:3-deoxy-manno-octulosonate cytidylyltransferase [Bacteroidales bacterium]MDD4213532.1 3-deoxy-manno-octulosonate cytidylyltransferase [Bacteroidales bacterium]
MNFVGIIPARYASTRFPGKPLIVIHGKSMVQRVYEQAKKSAVLSEVVVATDDNRIFEHVQQFGGKVMMTSSLHRTGTERCNEVVTLLEKENKFFDVAINIQGDEPYIQPEQINMLALCFNNSEVAIATLKKKVIPGDELNNPNTIKIVTDIYNNAIYFSRSVIPYKRDDTKQDIPYFKHIGIYAYKTNILKKIVRLIPATLETTESLEQLRWLENGYKIYIRETFYDSHSVDTPGDLSKFNNFADH